MEKQCILSIGREFGSGGHLIGKKLSEHYHLPFYDYDLLKNIASEKNLDLKLLESYDERPRNRFLTRTVRGFSNSPEENVARIQFEWLLEKAEKGESFVIVGRCSETVLKENPNMISMFILGDLFKKIERIMERHHVSKEEAKHMIEQMDRKRKTYHNHYCQGKWGDSRNYDISINSSKLGIDKTVDLLIDYIDERKKK